MSRFDDLFDVGLQDEGFYPGSKERRQPARLVAERELSPFDDVTPKIYDVNGKQVEFFTIGQLAAALGRKANTIRKWENTGVIPRATFQAPNPKGDPRARRRLYTRKQAEGIVRIAREEHIVETPSHKVQQIVCTRFTERVFALFKEIRGAE